MKHRQFFSPQYTQEQPKNSHQYKQSIKPEHSFTKAAPKYSNYNQQICANQSIINQNQTSTNRKGTSIRKNKPTIYISQSQQQQNGGQEEQTDFHNQNDPIYIAEKEMEQLSQIVKNIIVKNKLNTKNAFQVPLIDVTTLRAIRSNDDNSWSKISSVLENSSKVYAYRVDFMTESINKMTSSITRGQQSNKLELSIKKKQQMLQKNKYKQSEILNNQPNINNSIYYEDQIEDYSKHIEKQKINQQNKQLKFASNPITQNIRRMFDQNGVAGMLMARMPITKSLNISIDSSVQFNRPNLQKENSLYIRNEIIDLRNANNLTILNQIDSFAEKCSRKPIIIASDSSLVYEVIQDCCNLQIDDFTQKFRSQADVHTGFKDDYFMQTMRDQNVFQKSQEKNIQQKRFLQQLSKIENSLALNSQRDLNNLSMLMQPLQRIFEGVKKPKKEQKIKGKQKERKKKQKTKVQQILINFDTSVVDKQSTISCSLQTDLKKKKKTKQKNILRTLIPSFLIEKTTNYTPINTPPNPKNSIVQNDADQLSNLILSIQKQKNAQISHISYLQNFSQTQLGQEQEGIKLFKAPNIKVTKSRLWSIISQQRIINISKVQQIYQRQIGPLSGAIMFLSLLHLCNEKNIQIKQLQNFDLQIRNPHFENTQEA